MKLLLSMVLAFGLIGSAQAQSSQPTPQQSRQQSTQEQSKQQSAQDQAKQKQAAQEQTTKTKPAPRSSNPEDAHTSTTGAADKNAYQAGKKPDASAGCSTPTDAKSAGADTSGDSPTRKRADGSRTVCTTSGSEGVGAVDKSENSEKQKQRKAATAPSSTSAEPR